MKIWQLMIDMDNGRCVTVTGTEDVLRCEFDAWIKFKNEAVAKWAKEQKDAKQRGFSETDPNAEAEDDPAEYIVRVIHGFTDTSSQAPLELAYRFMHVDGMALVRLI